MKHVETKAKLKPNNVSGVNTNPQNICLSNSLADTKGLIKNSITNPTITKSRNTIGKEPVNQIIDQKLVKNNNLGSERTKPMNPIPNAKQPNRGSIKSDMNIVPIIQKKPEKDFIDSTNHIIQNSRLVGNTSSNVKNGNDQKRPSSPKTNQLSNQIESIMQPFKDSERKIPDSKNVFEMKQSSSKRLSHKKAQSKEMIKIGSASKSFIDKNNSSIMQNSKDEMKKDSIGMIRGDLMKLTQRSYELNAKSTREDGLKNSFVVGNQEEAEQSKISVEVLHSIKQILDDMKKSILDEVVSSSDEIEEAEILVLEDKVNRLRARLISQGFKYTIKLAERKNRAKKRDALKAIKQFLCEYKTNGNEYLTK